MELALSILARSNSVLRLPDDLIAAMTLDRFSLERLSVIVPCEVLHTPSRGEIDT